MGDYSPSMDTATADLESFMGEVDSFIHGRGAAPSADVQQQAQEEKAMGNRAFQQGDLATAERHYQRSLELWADNAAVYANRAQCRLKRGAAAAAEEDATRAVNLDVGYVKAYHRRALARVEQGKHSAALQGDFCAVLCAVWGKVFGSPWQCGLAVILTFGCSPCGADGQTSKKCSSWRPARPASVRRFWRRSRPSTRRIRISLQCRYPPHPTDSLMPPLH